MQKLWLVVYVVSRRFKAVEISHRFATEKQARRAYRKACGQSGLMSARIKHLVEDNVRQIIRRVTDPLAKYLRLHSRKEKARILRAQEKAVREVLEELCRS